MGAQNSLSSAQFGLSGAMKSHYDRGVEDYANPSSFDHASATKAFKSHMTKQRSETGAPISQLGDEADQWFADNAHKYAN